jgi:hypothetical protein
VAVSKGGKARHPVFREYFEQKVKEGKNKPQALVCVARRLVRIIYGMMTDRLKKRIKKDFEALCRIYTIG